jgi:hypothetical protein
MPAMSSSRLTRLISWLCAALILALAAWAGAVVLMNAGIDITLPRFARGALAVAPSPHAASSRDETRHFRPTISYLLVGAGRPEDYISYRFELDGAQTRVMFDNVAAWPYATGGYEIGHPCRTPRLRCIAIDGWFLPFIAQEHPHTEVYVQDGVAVSIGPSPNPSWAKGGCAVYDLRALKPGGPVMRQRYTLCPQIGIVDIVVFSKAAKSPDHLVLTSYTGLFADWPPADAGKR